MPKDKQVPLVLSFLRKLPRVNYDVLKIIISFLKTVIAAETNKMSAENCGISMYKY